MRSTLSLLAALLVLGACSRDDSPKGSAFVAAPAVAATPKAAAAPADPDFSPARSILFRECRQAYSVASCTCTVKMLKESVDEDTYKTMKSMGMMGVLAVKGAASDNLHAILGKAYDACAKAEDDATGPAPPTAPQATFEPTPKAKVKAK